MVQAMGYKHNPICNEKLIPTYFASAVHIQGVTKKCKKIINLNIWNDF